MRALFKIGKKFKMTKRRTRKLYTGIRFISGRKLEKLIFGLYFFDCIYIYKIKFFLGKLQFI